MRDLNFFSPYVENKIERQRKNQSVIIFLLAAGIAIIGTATWNVIVETNYIEKTNNLEEEINKYRAGSEYNYIESLKVKNLTLEKYFNSLKEVNSYVTNKEVIKNDLLNKINNTLPKGVNFKTLTISGKDISISGSSSTRIEIAELQHNLKAIEEIKEVVVLSINGDKDFIFNMKCLLKDVDEK